jgi:hypothetical protein
VNSWSLSIIACAVCSWPLSAAEILPPGHRPIPPGVHALTGAKVVPKPGEILEGATIVIRDGFIQAVGKNVATPADARLWDLKGATIYAGLIDPYLSLASTNPPVSTTGTEPFSGESLTAGGIKFFGVPGQERDPGNPGPGYELATITPERRVAQSYAPDTKTLEALRELGFTAGNVVPTRGIIRGTSAFVVLSDVNPNEALLKNNVFQHIAFDAEHGRDDAYPRSLMGVIAAIRQVFFDAQYYAQDQEHYRTHPTGRKRPAFNPALEALAPVIEKKMPVVFEPGSALMVDRAARVARELGVPFALLASGQEWRRPEFLKATGASFIVPLNYPVVSKLPEDDDWDQISLDQLRAWDWASENPALLRQ